MLAKRMPMYYISHTCLLPPACGRQVRTGSPGNIPHCLMAFLRFSCLARPVKCKKISGLLLHLDLPCKLRVLHGRRFFTNV